MNLLRMLDFRNFSGKHLSRTLLGLLGVIAVLALGGCTGGAARHESWPGMIVDDGVIYAANLESIDAVNAETGKLYWSYPQEADRGVGPFYSTPVLARDAGDYGVLVVAGFKDRTVYALALGESAAERPDELWRFSLAGGQYVGSGTIADGKFIIGNGDGTVYALDLMTGNPVWGFTTQDRVWATPVVDDGVVYIASLDHSFYAVDIVNGELLWSIKFDAAIAGTPVIDNGYAWVGDFSSKLHQIDLSEQTIAWTYEAEDWVWGTPLLVGRTLYFTDVGGHVYALNVDTREMLWESPVSIDDIIHGRPASNADGTRIYVSGYEKGKTFAIDVEKGYALASWGFEQKNPGQLPGDLVADDERLYTMPILIQERIQAFDLATGELMWPISTE